MDAPFRSRQFVIALEHAGASRKIFQIQFERGVGLFVNLPYFEYTHGLLGRYRLSDRSQTSQEIQLQDGGVTTSRRVKYAHHTDGEAHFSQTGQVRTQVRTHAAPLTDASGHLFTVQFGGFEQFRQTTARDERPRSEDRTVLTFGISAAEPPPVRIVGQWYHRTSMQVVGQGSLRSDVPNPVGLLGPDGVLTAGFLLSSPEESLGQDFRVTLSCHPMPNLDWSGRPFLLLLGGFSPVRPANDGESDEFIAVHYTDRAESFESLRGMLGSIDLPSGT